MNRKPDLLTCSNLSRHFKNKINKLNQIKTVIGDNELIRESLLAAVISCFEAAILDTIKEYVYARPYQFIEIGMDLIKNERNSKFDSDSLNLLGYENYFLDKYFNLISYKDNQSKIKELKKIACIDIDLGVSNWEVIRECIARRNCFIHNDLIVNGSYFNQAGQKAEDIAIGRRLTVDKAYLNGGIDSIIDFFENIVEDIEVKYTDNTCLQAVRNLWCYLFEDEYLFDFDRCWRTSGKSIVYKGPQFEELENNTSPRIICLFSAWKSFFNGAGCSDLKYFSHIFCNGFPAEERSPYKEKLKYLMDCFEKIDFQCFKVKIYDKD